jgi:predicted RecA/RadA family phage recombinase
MAATNDIEYAERQGNAYSYPVLAGVTHYGRAGVGVTAAGYSVPAGHVSAVALVGLAEERIDNSAGANGAKKVRAKKGIFKIPLSATPANVGSLVYMSDDATFTLVAGALLSIGRVHAVDADGTWLKID